MAFRPCGFDSRSWYFKPHRDVGLFVFLGMYQVYAISSQTRDYIYVGLTSNHENRLHRHNSGYERTTKPYRPFTLIYTKEFPDRPSARIHEKELKTTQGKRFLRTML